MRKITVVVSMFVAACFPHANIDRTLVGQAPQPTQQPAPLPPPQPAPQPAPPAPQPYYPPQPQPYYPPQPQPYYPPPAQAYYPPPSPPPMMYAPESGRSRAHDGEVIANFAAVGVLASVDIIVRQDVENAGVGTMILLGGLMGGGAGGWLLTQKYEVDGGAARSTTLGLMAGVANAALLIEPIGWTRPESILSILLVGSAVGAGGGFIYGQTAELTSAQAVFVGNLATLGTATAALGAITGSQDEQFGTWESGTIAIGLDAGLVAGALIAPHLDWSPRRSKVVFAATGVGALAGGMIAGLTTNTNDGSGSRDPNGNIVAACMTAGMWGGFALGVFMTRDSAPDMKHAKKAPPIAAPPAPAPTATTYAPWVGDRGQLGIMAGGTW
jgi:hypothetical protein